MIDQEERIARLVHDMMVNISDLSAASRDLQSALYVIREREDIALAHSELGRLVERLAVKMKVAS